MIFNTATLYVIYTSTGTVKCFGQTTLESVVQGMTEEGETYDWGNQAAYDYWFPPQENQP